MQTRFPLRNLQRWLHNILSVHQERNVETLDGFRGEKWLINHNSSVMQEDSSWEIKGKGIFSRELMFSLRTPVYVKSGEQLLEEQTLFSQNRFSEYNLGSSGIAGESCQ
ncbi:hypothetical protein MUK42_03082 [Musa troglodytarum]|uniref:Uncharacterized protein n=1 Tax=Musa troglodytarum TaxID=320322 RepID=A0A9E7KHV3_9LILI|nr:hypothetical protein MUK42_03082 [Musa troglodytarum]